MLAAKSRIVRIFASLALFALVPLVEYTQDTSDLPAIAQALVGSPTFDVGKQYAVIIGIDRYTEWPSLKGAVAEAKKVRDVLAARYYIDEFVELYDTDATAENIRKLFGDLSKRVGIKDSVLIFYAGHGYLDEANTGFWIASDGTTNTDKQDGWIQNSQLRNYIVKLAAQRVLVLNDACFSGDFVNTSRGLQVVSTKDPSFLAEALKYKARQVLSAGGSEEVPDDSEFGAALVDVLTRNTDPYIAPDTMYDNIRRSMSGKTEPLLGTITGHQRGASFVLFLRQEPKAQVAATAPASGEGAAEPSSPPPVEVAAIPPAADKGAPAASPEVAAAAQGSVGQSKQAQALAGRLVISLRPAQSPSPDSQITVTGVDGDRTITASADQASEMDLAPGDYDLKASFLDDSDVGYRGKAHVNAGEETSIEIPLDYSAHYKIAQIQTTRDDSESRLQSLSKTRGRRGTEGAIFTVLGLLGGSVAAFSYLEGNNSMLYSQTATAPNDSIAYGSQASTYRLLFAGTGVVGIGLLTAGVVTLFARPSASEVGGLKRSVKELDDQIRTLSASEAAGN
jgi:hypothetical protein